MFNTISCGVNILHGSKGLMPDVYSEIVYGFVSDEPWFGGCGVRPPPLPPKPHRFQADPEVIIMIIKLICWLD